MAINFIQFSENVKLKKAMLLISTALRPLIADCTGTIYFSDPKDIS